MSPFVPLLLLLALLGTGGYLLSHKRHASLVASEKGNLKKEVESLQEEITHLRVRLGLRRELHRLMQPDCVAASRARCSRIALSTTTWIGRTHHRSISSMTCSSD